MARGLKQARRCECGDPKCPVHGPQISLCERRATVVLYRVDMADETGTDFCDDCADDAADSGLFTDQRA